MIEPARRLHARLVDALERLRRAEESAVTLFARVMQDESFKTLGHATIELYGTEGLGLSLAKTRQFIRLARALDALPATRAALDAGRLSWTKARTLSAVATPRTEERWVAAAAGTTSRELEAKVRQAKERGRRERDRLRRRRGQAALVLDTPKPLETPIEVPVTVSLTMTPVQHARYQALMERHRKKGRKQGRVDLLLEGLASLGESTREASATPYHIVAYRCDTCKKTTVNGHEVSPATTAAMQCDAVHVSSYRTVPNRSSIPPAVRRAVLVRDEHRCTTPGCGARRFLEVHHVKPRSEGGTNEAENLRTLCSACHRFVHERGEI